MRHKFRKQPKRRTAEYAKYAEGRLHQELPKAAWPLRSAAALQKAWVVIAGMLFVVNCAIAAEPGSSVAVVYNSKMPESKQVADYYAQRRQVPKNQVFGFDLPVTESMSRDEFTKKLVKPLWKQLEDGKLWTLAPATNATAQPKGRQVTASTFRYVLLCYGVPTRVLPDPNLVEPGTEQMKQELRRNEASVDSDLACLPIIERGLKWTGPMINPFYGVTNAALMNPTNGLIIVTRLDGPSASVARGLVDKAMEAETNGLWGHAYIDCRGIKEGGYKVGDDWMRISAGLAAGMGFEVDLDQRPETFSAGFPMSDIAIYAGWYDENVSGPFTLPEVEFAPGAFAYHLHSFSAQILRTTNHHWVGPLLAKGATITMGCVNEPYLEGSPDVAMFLSRFLYLGFSFGEAAYAGQNSLSWQNIAVGDPLYRPFGKDSTELQAEAERCGGRALEYAKLKQVNLQLASRMDLGDVITGLERLPLTRKSPVLLEKLADLCWRDKRLSDAIDADEKALKLNPGPQQKIRLLLMLAERQAFYGPDKAGYAAYEKFLREAPNFPDKLIIYKKMLKLAQNMEKPDEVKKLEEIVQKLSPPSPPTSPPPASVPSPVPASKQ